MNLLTKIIENIQNPRDVIETKTVVKKANFCPPHYWPHKRNDGNPITNEPCHFHTTWKHQFLHHQPYCFAIRCPNYKTMMKAKGEHKK
jgi:hypothetical protein